MNSTLAKIAFNFLSQKNILYTFAEIVSIKVSLCIRARWIYADLNSVASTVVALDLTYKEEYFMKAKPT